MHTHTHPFDCRVVPMGGKAKMRIVLRRTASGSDSTGSRKLRGEGGNTDKSNISNAHHVSESQWHSLLYNSLRRGPGLDADEILSSA